VLLDWLPWSHTFGGNQTIGIDDLHRRHAVHRRRQAGTGVVSPRPCATCARSRRRLYFNVPKGYEQLAQALEADPSSRIISSAGCR
jgi:feruloyl-CoA synthase